MSAGAGTWASRPSAGHACDVYEPPRRNPHGYVVMYLHGVHLGRLDENESVLPRVRSARLCR